MQEERVDLMIKMYDQRNDFDPPLTVKEIFDFVNTELPDQDKINEAWEHAENLKRAQEARKKWEFVNYTTKKELKQAIKETNEEIDGYVVRKRTEKNNLFLDIHIEECLEKKEKLKKRLAYISKIDKTKGENDKELAKTVPIDHFYEFKGGFAKCLWHNEKTGSLKYYPEDNHVYCFSCQKRGDTIDVVMAIHNLDFNKAVKFILGK